jgi:hypothetical protein
LEEKKDFFHFGIKIIGVNIWKYVVIFSNKLKQDGYKNNILQKSFRNSFETIQMPRESKGNFCDMALFFMSDTGTVFNTKVNVAG